MNELLSIFLEHGILILSTITILIAIAVLAISNAEDFPHFTECFTCTKTSCHGCSQLASEIESEKTNRSSSKYHNGSLHL